MDATWNETTEYLLLKRFPHSKSTRVLNACGRRQDTFDLAMQLYQWDMKRENLSNIITLIKSLSARRFLRKTFFHEGNATELCLYVLCRNDNVSP